MGIVRNEFSNFNLNDVLFNWKTCTGSGLFKERRLVPWSSPPFGVLKFNVHGALMGKPGLGIGGVFRNCRGEVLLMFSKNVGVRDSKAAEVLAILEVLRLFSSDCLGV